MDSLKISTGEKRICINDDPERVIVFDPTDILFAEKFYALANEFTEKLTDFKARADELESAAETDENGLPVNLANRLALMRESCEYMHGRIDWLFGAGTARTVFGEGRSLDAIGQFFEGITPFIRTVRSEKVNSYSPKRARRMA